jgi:Family of unknown function (DUF5691)
VSQSSGWWDELAVGALLGTDRRPQLETSLLPAELGRAAARLSGDRAAVLLDAAALAVAYRRGGTPPEQVPSEPERAPAEPRPGPTPRAAALLADLFARKPDLVGYWCEAAAAAGLVAAEAQLPALLDLAATQPALRPAIIPVLGRRGRWLARMQPSWAPLAAIPDGPDQAGDRALADPAELDPRVWEFGAPAARLAWMRSARRTDPAAGLAALAGTWARESWPDRARFLPLLAIGLGPADEALLETALSDARPEIRRAAAELLATLPASGYAGRMRARAEAFVRRDTTPGSAPGRVIIDVPERLDPAAIRDGLSEPPAVRPMTLESRRLWWLEQVVASTPLDDWLRLFDSARQAVEADFDDVAQAAIRAGWVWAAARQRNREWAVAVLRAGTRLRVEELLPLLDDAELAEALRARLSTLGGADLELVVRYLAAGPSPWPEPVARIALGWLLARIPEISPVGPRARPLLELIGQRFPLGEGGAMLAAAADSMPDDLWRYRLSSVAEDISDRTRIHEELQ